jgi:hypothetical protein
LQNVDNVPLLVSLYTDSTPETICDMVGIFREYGEVVLTIGSGYRAYNHSIYMVSDIATSVTVLPSVKIDNKSIAESIQFSYVPANVNDLIDTFPSRSISSLCRGDLVLSFRLIGIGTYNLLQYPYSISKSKVIPPTVNFTKPFDSSSLKSQLTNQHPLTNNLKLSVLLETVRKGRIFLINTIQCLAFISISSFSIG